MSAYVPVPCALHSTYERYVLAGRPVRVTWRARGTLHQATLWPRDVVTREGAEYWILAPGRGPSLDLRLDRIVAVTPA